MQRSRTQTLFSYLPNTVFFHEAGVIVKAHSISGEELSGSVNRSVLLREIDSYLRAWEPEDRGGLPLPSEAGNEEFRIVSPALVRWDVWPLVFECSRENCRRIRTFIRLEDVKNNPRCRFCRGRLRQLRYISTHACGALREMFVPKCAQDPSHGYDHVYFDDTGSFRTSVFRCRACGGSVIRRTAQSPCQCGAFEGPDGRSIMRAFTVRDTRAFYSHYVTLINLQSPNFARLQGHPSRGEIAIGSYLGVVGSVAAALRQADREGHGGGSQRLSADEWGKREAQLRQLGGLKESEISAIRDQLGPLPNELSAIKAVGPAVVSLGGQMRLLERALLFDRDEVARISLDYIEADALRQGRTPVVQSVRRAMSRAQKLGIEEVAVTWNFPIALASFGYTRTVRERGAGRIRGFAQQGRYDGKTPVFAVASDTEAVLVTLSARRVLEWLTDQGDWLEVPTEDRKCREAILQVFANRESVPAPAEKVETLLHSISHVLLRALDDGQIGFAESSLAEWLVPETLTFALYVNNLKSYTLGALWTLLTNRAEQWLARGYEAIWSCENDPLCHQRRPRACERCLFTSFGCPRFNGQLSRELLQGFWRSSRRRAALSEARALDRVLSERVTPPGNLDDLCERAEEIRQFGRVSEVRGAVACARLVPAKGQSLAEAALASINEWLLKPTPGSAASAAAAGYRAYVAFLGSSAEIREAIGLGVSGLAATLVLESEERLRVIEAIAGEGGIVEKRTIGCATISTVVRLAGEHLLSTRSGTVASLWSAIRTELTSSLTERSA